MTNEDKAKAYDEAMERAKEMIESKKTFIGKKCLEHIFPELAESEDERIMKELLTDIPKVFPYDKANRYITYLEKQKELDMLNSTELIQAWETEKRMLEEKDFRGDEWRLAQNTYLDGFALGCAMKMEKQKEHKPLTIESAYEKFVNPETLKGAQTNKYIRVQLLWELMHNGIITEVDYLYLRDDKRKPWTQEEYRKAYQEGFKISEQLKQKEQKSVECKKHPESKTFEDEWTDYYNNSLMNRQPMPNKREIAKHFFWFGKQQVDKPAEWSEEDEKMLIGVLDGIKNLWLYDFRERCITWLKSLRPQPQWKPSEEQMEALKECGECKRCIKQLYEQLKKLM